MIHAKIKFHWFISLAFPLFLYSQPSNTGNWLIYMGDCKINKKWNIHNEFQLRNYNKLGDVEQLLLRTGLGYNLTENNNNALIGYAYIYSEPYMANTDNKTSIKEHRLYQQFITRQSFGRAGLQHRYRLEERFFSDDIRIRFRYFLATTVALNREQMKEKTLYLTAYGEIFTNTKKKYFDRFRLYGGIGYRFNKHIRTELGFMNQTTNSLSRNQFNLFAFVNF